MIFPWANFFSGKSCKKPRNGQNIAFLIAEQQMITYYLCPKSSICDLTNLFR